MSSPDRFARIAGRVNLDLADKQLVVIVGVGTVGSQIAEELANSGVGRLRLIDGDCLETANLVRHVLPQSYVGMNKAEGLALYLSDEIPTLRPEALPRYINNSLTDGELDGLLADADLVVAATDDRDAQRRLGRRALALDTPAIFPALYGDSGGEVFVQLDPGHPCFLCWDAFRTENERLRSVAALNADTLALIQLAVHLSVGLLDDGSDYADLLRPTGQAQPQIFIQNEFALAIRPVAIRPTCPACAIGPAQSRVASSLLVGSSSQRLQIEATPRRLEQAAPNGPISWAWVAGISLAVLAIFTIRLATKPPGDGTADPAAESAALRAQRHEHLKGDKPPGEFLVTKNSIGALKVGMAPKTVESIWGLPESREVKARSKDGRPIEVWSTYRIYGKRVILTFMDRANYRLPNLAMQAYFTRSPKFKDKYGHGVGNLMSTVQASYNEFYGDIYGELAIPIIDGLQFIGSSYDLSSEIVLVFGGSTDGYFGETNLAIIPQMGVPFEPEYQYPEEYSPNLNLNYSKTRNSFEQTTSQ